MLIMFCYDGSTQSKNALDTALELFKGAGVAVMLFHVIEGSMGSSSESEGLFKETLAERRKMMDAVGTELTSKGIEVDIIIAQGDPRTMISEACERKRPDVVVVGKRGLGTVQGIMLGSVSAYLTRHLTCAPLMII
ncbi:MAG: universal stress protein [Deltaproteobacteria bacterium]|nr:universal stress protein [Deltaproteobacteria bacterium]